MTITPLLPNDSGSSGVIRVLWVVCILRHIDRNL